MRRLSSAGAPTSARIRIASTDRELAATDFAPVYGDAAIPSAN